MSKDRHHRLHELFTAAVELPADQRDDWLQEECDGDPALLSELQALLTQDQRSQDPLEAGVRQVLRQRGNGPAGDETLSRTSLLDDFDIAKRHGELPDSELSSNEFCDQLSEIDVLSGDKLVKWLESVQPPETREDPQALARQLVTEGKLTEFQASVLLGGKSKKLLIDKYLILDLLDSGGMGMVFKAVHRTMKRVVALKMLPPGRFSSPAAVQRFRREVEVAATLEHPNIVTAHDADESKGVHFLVMEYARGRDLYKKVTADGPLSVAQAVQCVLQAAAGLQHAHEKGIIHRDIKPGNLILADTKTIKILDLGLASISERAEPEAGEESERTGDQLTRSGALLGTVAYMAPEQAVNSANVDARCDIYSLGCTFYFLLTGETPYGSDPVKSIDRHQIAEVPGLRDKRPDVPEAVDTIYHKMLAKDPNDRQQSMAELIAALKVCKLPECNRNLPRSGEAKNVDTIVSSAKSAKPFRAKRAIGGLIGVTVIGFLSVILLRNEPNEPTPSAPPPDVTDVSSVFNDHPPFAIAAFNSEEARQLQKTWAEFLGVPVEKVITLPGGETLKMVLIPPGEFDMGSSDEERLKFLNDANQDNDTWSMQRIPSEGPQHRVRITRPFYLSNHEVTQAQWLSVTGTNPAQFSENPKNPVEQVSWLEVQKAFINKLNDHATSMALRFALPTEAQWEYAGRAGTETFWPSGSDETTIHQHIWSSENSSGAPQPVGQLLPNAFGLYDMHGNVMELCADSYTADYYSKSPMNDPFNSNENKYIVRRGGSWQHLPSWSRSAHRGRVLSHEIAKSTGFRLAASIDLSSSKDTPQWVKDDPTISSLMGKSDELRWTVPEKLAEPINSAFQESRGSLARDGLTLLFTSARGNSGKDDIWIARRESLSDPFTNPQPLPGEVNTKEYYESSQWLSDDGKRIYFQSNRPGGPGSFDIWWAQRESVNEPFEEPSPLPNVNSKKQEWTPVLSADELTIVFSASFRSDGKGRGDLYIAQREKRVQPFGEAKPLENLNSPRGEVATYLRRDGRLLFFTSSERVGDWYHQLFAAYRADPEGSFGNPIRIPPPIASGKLDLSLTLSEDGKELILASGAGEGYETLDLYRSRLVRKDPSPSEDSPE